MGTTGPGYASDELVSAAGLVPGDAPADAAISGI